MGGGGGGMVGRWCRRGAEEKLWLENGNRRRGEKMLRDGVWEGEETLTDGGVRGMERRD